MARQVGLILPRSPTFATLLRSPVSCFTARFRSFCPVFVLFSALPTKFRASEPLKTNAFASFRSTGSEPQRLPAVSLESSQVTASKPSRRWTHVPD